MNNSEREFVGSQSSSALTVVAFHTNDELYTQEAKRMKASAQALGLLVLVEEYDSVGSWVKNAAIKAKFLLEMRQNLSGPILYVDVDAVFHHDPTEYLLSISQDCDIAVHYDCQDHHLMSGTMLLNDTKNTENLLNKWVDYCNGNSEVWDQKALEIILEEYPQFICTELPVVFCWVFDREYNFSLKNGLPIYIEHLQASRSVKKQKGFLRRLFKKNKALDRRKQRIKAIEQELGL